jgi:hypothetical protein
MLHFYHVSWTDSVKLQFQLFMFVTNLPDCFSFKKFSWNFVVINASEGSLCFLIFILHNSRCQVLCGSCKKLPRTSLQLLYFSGPSGSLMPALLSVENWVPLKPVLGGVRDVARIHYRSCTDSIKPSLQFSWNFVVINASEGSLCFQIFIFGNNIEVVNVLYWLNVQA